MSQASPETELARLNAATAGLEPPFAAVDLRALRANAGAMTRRAVGKPIRLASKRSRAVGDPPFGPGESFGSRRPGAPEENRPSGAGEGIVGRAA